MIYLDNAATTQRKPLQVIQAVVRAMETMGNSGRGVHEGSLHAARTIYETRMKLAEFFGCSAPERVIFTANATESLNIAISGLFSSGDHVIATDWDHNSVLRPLYRLGNADFIPADSDGRLDYGSLPRLLKSNTRAVVCTHASNLTGDLTDIALISAFCRKNGLLFVLDASQTAGTIPLRMEEQGIDVLCFTGHKGLMGPQGTGGLCVGPGGEIEPFKVGGSGVQTYSVTHPREYPTRLEAGTLNGHGIAGLGAAVDYLQEVGMEKVHERELSLALRFYEAVKTVPGVTVYGDFTAADRAAIVTLNIRDMDSALVSDRLAEEYGIATRSGGHCAPRFHRALGTQEQGAVRFSFGWFNTDEEADAAAAAIREVACEG